MFDFRKVAKASVGGSPLMSGSPIKTAEILNTPLTIVAVDTVDLTNKQGHKQEVGVINFMEMPNRYYLGGQALTNVILAWRNEWAKVNNGEFDANVFNDAIAKAGVKISLRMTTTRGGNSFVVVDILNN